MKVTLSTVNGDVYVLEVPADMELENFKALAESEVGIPANEIILLHNMRPLVGDKRPLSEQGVSEGDILLVNRGGTSQAAPEPESMDLGSVNVANPAEIRDRLLANPPLLTALRNANPSLADAAIAGLEPFTQMLDEVKKKEAERARMLSADPFDPEAQQLIAEHIRQQNINSNMEAAMEYHPESFGIVTMLYINCRVNGHPVKAFVDSGAQSTIISSACAERCGIMRLVDPRWAGIAKGVGTQKIIGRIHLVAIEIEKDYLNTSFSVLEDQTVDMLLGLDMLKRHQCVIDLKRDCLVIGTSGTETRFLPESELPTCARLGMEPMNEGAQKDNMSAGAFGSSTSDASTSQATSSVVTPRKELLSGHQDSTNGVLHDEKVVSEICAMGFKRDDVIQELTVAKGDKNRAIGALFAKSFVVPK
ncbi:protein DDI1 homolog 2-like isoform X1 [Varroa destructor]|uniref:DNA damage-inducible protein 1 n=2 Tax=Varroa destructor TaxID=109461 RepID=A0A7M7KMN3_VARDE|nr:protein DDI1 homolog 2-like isoform X1 [Varroa destructor]